MSSSAGSSVVNSCLRVGPIEGDDELLEANMDLLRVHVRLIMAGILTMEESKPVLLSAFSALRGFGLDNRVGWLMHIGGLLESLLGRREKMILEKPAAEAARRVTQEQFAGLRPGWSDV